jgi:hypothetical protein
MGNALIVGTHGYLTIIVFLENIPILFLQMLKNGKNSWIGAWRTLNMILGVGNTQVDM